jgi:hypothetical protein
VARLSGRLAGGLTLWRGHRARGLRAPVKRAGWSWSERWVAPEERLGAVEAHLMSSGRGVRRGGAFDRWDLELRDEPLGSARLLLSVEELGGGAQLVRYRCWPVVRRVTVGSVLVLVTVALAAAWGSAEALAGVAAAAVAALAALAVAECAAAMGTLLAAVTVELGLTDDRAPSSPKPRERSSARKAAADGPGAETGRRPTQGKAWT